MQNISKLTEELRSSLHISDGTINSILEANISHSKVGLPLLFMAGAADLLWSYPYPMAGDPLWTLCVYLLIAQVCLSLCNTLDRSPSASSVHEI